MKYSVVALGVVLLPFNLYAADLLGLYQQAKQSDPQIREARANRNAGQEARPQAMAGLLPSVNLSGDLTYTHKDILSSPTAALVGSSQYASNSLALSLVQPLFRKDRLVALEQSGDRVRQADAQLQAARQGLILRVAQSYFGVLSAKDDLTFAETEKKAISRQLDQAQQRFDVGLVAITDVHEAQARFDQARAAEISAQNEVDNAMEALREIVADAGSALAGLRDEVPLVPPAPSDIDAWSQTALQNNPQVLVARLASRIAEKDVEAKRAGHYPSLDLVGSLSRSRVEDNFGNDVDNAALGVQLSVPFYAGGAVDSATRQASYQYEAAREALETERRAVRRQVRDAYLGVQTSISRVKALAATERSAQSALEATEAGFEAGTRTLVDVLNSQRDLFRAKRDFAQARYNYVLNTLSLLQAAGTLAEEDLSRVNAWLQ